ncbi:MAG: NFACT RNA binding domain-containing protein [Cyanobacteria bacterium P01_D01_bin.123]
MCALILGDRSAIGLLFSAEFERTTAWESIIVQPFDLTTLIAVRHALCQRLLPARLEVIQQSDLWTLHLGLRTLRSWEWLTLSWHPQAARVHGCAPVPKAPDPFQFSQQIQKIRGLALVDIIQTDPWERVLKWQFASRPGEIPRWHLYLEMMGKHSNIALTNERDDIVACGRGVSEKQSRVRSLQPGLRYEPPPPLQQAVPNAGEPFAGWQDRLHWPTAPIGKHLLRGYRGLSRMVVVSMLAQADIDPQTPNEAMSEHQWRSLWQCWQEWLRRLNDRDFLPGRTESGYSVLGWQVDCPAHNLDALLENYYSRELDIEQFGRDRHRLSQKLRSLLRKLYQRHDQFVTQMKQSDRAEATKQAADLLMANLHVWQPGMGEIELPDFETGQPVKIALDAEKNAIVNAQRYYKKHGKFKRARQAIQPLWEAVSREIHYLEQVESAIADLDAYRTAADLQALQDIERELIQQKYLPASDRPIRPAHEAAETQVHRFTSPHGREIWVGRNNRQNDWLTFRAATASDWWLHAQEIPGSHALLRLPPGDVADEEDFQLAADLAAHFSRGRQSDRVPVVCTRPKHVRKPKGVPPGMVVYVNERVIWAQPARGAAVVLANGSSTAARS